MVSPNMYEREFEPVCVYISITHLHKHSLFDGFKVIYDSQTSETGITDQMRWPESVGSNEIDG